MVDGLVENLIPGGLVRLSKNGWINTDLFFEWFNNFLVNIPLQRPVILLMDSHASHLSPQILELAAKNDVHIGEKPSRVNFNSLLTPAWQSNFIPQTIINSFRKTGIFPIGRYAITYQAIAPSLVLERPQAHQQSTNDGNTT
ncbi:hypothetical protein PR048_014703 [Dryococelus australis]|uniref:DDE-1 domain-containing protein n=1 Tax=Dryococelus australis TaxID=614101 RepID=A0ABQ9HEY9_9NEOP|nr:hypothetical protein PR048_014703 [Dryococelus australis]